ncbi:MAG TPA: ABC transporter permease, partial [Chthonomonadaceae bacterium]|nr:ABC transporter permease [Chthonomonadaceae bacterium]
LGVLLALVAAPLVALYLYRTPAGFGLRVVGQNAEAARTARLPIDRLRVQAMLVSGGLCGLAGGIELLGVTGRLGRDFSPGWGYTAIPVALLGGLAPGGTLLASLFFGALAAGLDNAQRTVGVPSYVAYVVQAATVLAIVAGRAWRRRNSDAEAD